MESGREILALHGHRDHIAACAVTPDGRHVISASWDSAVKVWDLLSGREVATFDAHAARVSGCTLTPDGRRVVSASWDRTLKIWAPPSPTSRPSPAAGR